MLSLFISVFEFLLRSLFDLAIFSFMSRFILQLVKADFFNPLSQLIVKLTDPWLRPARRYIPSIRGIDTACVMIIMLLSLLKLTLIFWIQFQKNPHISGLLIWSLGDVITAALYFFFFAVLAQALMSWINPGQSQQPLNVLLSQITAPLMRPVKRFLKPIGGFDLTPLPVIIALQLIIMIIATPLMQIGLALALHP